MNCRAAVAPAEVAASTHLLAGQRKAYRNRGRVAYPKYESNMAARCRDVGSAPTATLILVAPGNARYRNQFVAAGGRKKFLNFADNRGSFPAGYSARAAANEKPLPYGERRETLAPRKGYLQ
jgi:hypothetical protein